MPITYNREAFFDLVRSSVFAGRLTASQKDGTEAILSAWERFQPEGDVRFIAYALATATWETAHTMQPIEEIGRGRGRAYGVPAGPWRQVYFGRGFVQLTWIANYQRATMRLRVRGILGAGDDLARTPDLAMRPDIAAAIMFSGMSEGWFTGKKLADYFGAGSDWVDARRIINGTDHAADIAAIAEHFFAALKAAATRTPPAAAAPIQASIAPPALAAPAPPAIAAAPIAPAVAAATFLSRIASLFGR